MNKLHIITLSALMVLVSSCFKDKSNYDFTDAEKVTVTGINPTYDRISLVDSVNIIPKVTSTDPAAKFSYYWAIYETAVQGYAPKLDTICKTQALHYLVTKAAKTYVLVFGAKNLNTGYTSIQTTNLNVITRFTRGWYVLKDDGSKSDLDLFLTPTNSIPGSKLENVYSMVNGKTLDGKAKFLCFESTYKSMIPGILANTRVMFVVSSKDASVIDVNTLKEIHDFNGSFFSPPAVKAPNVMMLGSQGDYFVNNGLVYSIYTMSANNGLWGAYQLRDAVYSPYRVSDFYAASYVADPIFFDETSSSFVSAGAAGFTLNPVKDATITDMKANNNNKTLLYMGVKVYYPLAAVAVLQDKTNTSLKILSQITASASAFKMVNDTLLASSQLYKATMYTTNVADESMLYFVVGGNQVWSRNLTNKFEQLQYTAPAGEVITYIRHLSYSVTNPASEAAFKYNYIAVGTKIGSTYNVRMFTKTAGNLATTPAFTLTGTGSVGSVFYLSPSVSYATYNLTY